MLGRNTYTQEEVDNAKTAVGQQLAAYKKLAEAVAGPTTDANTVSALEAFEPLFFNNMLLALDRPFVHRVRMVSGKDSNPLNEVELISDSLMNNDGVLTGNKVIKWNRDQTVLKLNIGDRIEVGAAQFDAISAAFFEEIEARFL
jgi:hypothetical protein